MNEGVDVGPTLTAPNDRLTLDDGQMGQVSERVDQHAKRQPALFQQGVCLRDLQTEKTKGFDI